MDWSHVCCEAATDLFAGYDAHWAPVRATAGGRAAGAAVHARSSPARPAAAAAAAAAGEVTAVDFFAGIGGNHYALCQACDSLGLRCRVVAAVEVNDLATLAYGYNFPSTKVLRTSVEGLQPADLERLGAAAWLMSPPCQPFTRQGKGGDWNDPRTRPLFHLLLLLRQMSPERRPRMLFVENVRNFESSHTRWALLRALSDLRYSVRERLLSPVQLGVPNSRLRYYLTAWLPPSGEPSPSSTILTELPASTPAGDPPTLAEFLARAQRERPPLWIPDSGSEAEAALRLTVDQLRRPQTKVIDVVLPSSKRCCCFTKGYHQYYEGTGSLLCCAHGFDTAAVRAAFARQAAGDADALLPLRLRYFSPREVAQLLCLPCVAEDGPPAQGEARERRFVFHPKLTARQRYRLLGNSVCVRAVSEVLTALLRDALPPPG
eukprot:TRINITY_DN13802_c1_g1_i1.p1 TRINITY_DN13802_c1_g1~~TRINITY_DN13802_c1_g1_i1.p1  ORF type:complete len:456 (+),score=102.34 TRINITY_DN13802_c1_g1_i1:72-1370(+)